MKKAHAARLLIAVLVLEMVSGAELDLFVPSFPMLQSIFQISPFMVEWTLGVNLIAYAGATFFAGYLGERYGSRRVIIWGLWVFCIGSTICIVAMQFWHLLVGRFLQGLGIAAPAVLAYVIIAEAYALEKQQAWLGIINGASTLAMALAPVVGCYIAWGFGWRGNFIALGILGVLSLILCAAWVPRTLPVRAAAETSYYALSVNPRSRYYVMLITCLVTPYWIFVGVAPILYIQDGGIDLRTFGFYQGSLAALFAVGSFLTGTVICRFGQRKVLQWGGGLLLLGLFALMALTVAAVKEPLVITGVMLLCTAGNIYPVNLLYPRALEAVPHAKAKLAAAVNAMRLIASAIGVQLVGYFYNGTFTPIGACMIVLLFGAIWSAYQVWTLDRHRVLSHNR